MPPAGLLTSIRREIHALFQLEHPGIVRILDEGLHGGLPWYATEMLEGATLQQWKSRLYSSGAGAASPGSEVTRTFEERPTGSSDASVPAESGSRSHTADVEPLASELPERLREVLGLVRRLCFALSYLHGEGIGHRNLKPDNILVRPDG